MRKKMTYQGRLLIAARESVYAGSRKITSDMHGTIRSLHRQGKTIPEIIEVLHLEVRPHALYIHALKHLQLRLRMGRNKVAHRGDITAIPYDATDQRSFKPKIKIKN